jgi:hypothetical protein
MSVSNPHTNKLPIIGGLAILALAGVTIFAPQRPNPPKPPVAATATETLGSMEDAEWTQDDALRLAALRDEADASNYAVIQRMIAHPVSDVGRHDFELMRQDRRRALAANPEVNPKALLTALMIQVDASANVPANWGGPGAPTRAVGGAIVLAGSIVVTFVNPMYPKRATAKDTKAFFAQRDQRLATIRARGPMIGSYVPGGASNFHLVKDPAGDLISFDLIDAANPAQIALTRVRMPFVAEEWLNIFTNDPKPILALPSYAKAIMSSAPIRHEGLDGSAAPALVPALNTTTDPKPAQRDPP